MKKGIIFAAAAAILMMSGCDVTEDNIDQTPQPADITYIRWGMESLGSNGGNAPFAGLNERLEAEGSNIRVEAVEMDMGYDENVTFGGLVEEYEKENGSLDIVTYGADLLSKVGAANIFFESGYFRELSEEDKACFTDIPEMCWEAGKVNGKLYSVPALNFGLDPDIGMFIYFNTKYISEDKLSNFGGTVGELEAILSEVVPSDTLTGLEYPYNYLSYNDYTSASQMGGLYFSDKTMRASNPYETEETIEHARALNILYQKGYLNYSVNFSDWDDDEDIKTDFAVCVGDVYDRSQLGKRLGKDYKVTEFHYSYYMENRLLSSTGIPIASSHPDEAMELLKMLHSDKELSGLLTPYERDAIGLPRDNEPVDIGEVKLSPFAGFRLKYTDIDVELQELLVSSFDRLCKSEDFDTTLAEINTELKAAGIDDYVAKVNQLLEESDAAANQ